MIGVNNKKVYYDNQLATLTGAEVADKFNTETEESKKKIKQRASIVKKRTQQQKGNSKREV